MTPAPTTARRERMLVFRTGHLGDTMVALPALRDLRADWPRAEFCLLHDDRGGGRVTPRDILEPEHLFSAFVAYDLHGTNRHGAGRVREALRTFQRVARARFTSVAYLAPTDRSRAQVARDRLLFVLAGARRLVGFRTGAQTARLGRRSRLSHEADLLRVRLRGARPPEVTPCDGDAGLEHTDAERRDAQAFIDRLAPVGRGSIVAVAPATMMPSTRWPPDRFEDLVRRLVASHDVWPIVVGGPDDAAIGRRLIATWGRGSVAAGTMPPRTTAALLAHCRLFVGCDSGALHLAASAGTPCVGIYSMRGPGGAWYPYGRGHVVLERDVPCRGCMLVECVEHENLCTRLITVEDVERACVALLAPPQADRPSHGTEPTSA